MQMQVNTEKEALLRKISSLGLAVYDTKLYLDTHDCPEAREYMYSKYTEYFEAVALYDEKYGSIAFRSHPSEDMVWAWQIEYQNGRC